MTSQKNPPRLKNLIKTPRNASFELVRIIAMLLIVSQHFFGHGGWRNVTGDANLFFMYLTAALFRPSVNVFVMISAYFMCTNDNMRFPIKKLGKLWLTVSFYSILLFTVFTAAGLQEFSATELLSSLFPVAGGKYWFVSAYFFMMAISPLLNAIISRLSKAQFTLICIFIIVIAGLQDLKIFNTVPLARGYTGIWFCMLYLIAAYIRKYDITLCKIKWFIGALLFVGATILITFLWTYPGNSSIVTAYMAIFIILTAKNVKISNVGISRIICFISSLTFGVYLIHDSNELRAYMYENIFHSSDFIPSQYSYLIYIGFVLITFTVCAALEYVRQIGFNGIAKLTRLIFGNKIDLLHTKLKSFTQRIADKINANDITPA